MGHNRYEICTENGWKYRTVDQFCADRDDAKIWIIRNQFGRRNLQPFQRGELALILKPLIAAKAQVRRLETLKRGDLKPDTQKSAEREKGETRQEVARVAGISAASCLDVSNTGPATPAIDVAMTPVERRACAAAIARACGFRAALLDDGSIELERVDVEER